jgi:translation initiation factor IF-3
MKKRQTKTRSNEPLHRINSNIRVPDVRLTGENVANSGDIVSTYVAQRLANDLGLDLVKINSAPNPPICQILDYKKFLFEEKKRKKDHNKKQKEKVKDLKEMQFKPNIDTNDLEVKTKKVRDFLEKGHKVKVTMRFSGREKYMETYQDKGMVILLTLAEEIVDVAKVDNMPKFTGSSMIMTLSPKK